MQFFKFIILCLIILISNLCFSQVNIESMRNEKKDTLSGFIQGGLNFQKSNVDILEVNTSVRLDYHIRKYKEKILFLGKYGLGQQNGKDFKNEIFTHLRLNVYPISKKSPLSGEAFYQIQKDDFELLQIRQLFGCGGRIESDKTKNFRFAFGLGMMADHEKIKSLDHNVRVLSEITNEIKITKVLSFNFTLSYKYDSDTPQGVIENELKSNSSLKYNF